MIWLHFLPPLKREHGGSEIDGKALVIYAAKLLIKIHPLFRISFHPYDTLKGSLNANRRRHNGIKEGLKHPHLTERWFLWVVESERGTKKKGFFTIHTMMMMMMTSVKPSSRTQQIALFVEISSLFLFLFSNMFTNNLLDACFFSIYILTHEKNNKKRIYIYWYASRRRDVVVEECAGGNSLWAFSQLSIAKFP